MNRLDSTSFPTMVPWATLSWLPSLATPHRISMVRASVAEHTAAFFQTLKSAAPRSTPSRVSSDRTTVRSKLILPARSGTDSNRSHIVLSKGTWSILVNRLRHTGMASGKLPSATSGIRLLVSTSAPVTSESTHFAYGMSSTTVSSSTSLKPFFASKTSVKSPFSATSCFSSAKRLSILRPLTSEAFAVA